MTTAAIRTMLYDYIRTADDKRLKAIYNLLGQQIDTVNEWWKDKELLADFDERSKALESGADKGFTLDELDQSIKLLSTEANPNI